MGTLIADRSVTLGPVGLQGLHLLFLASGVLRYASLGFLTKVDPGRRLEPHEVLARLARLQASIPMYGINQAVGIGMAAAENANAALARGSAALERSIERRIAESAERLKQVRDRARQAEERIDEKLAHHEARIDALLDWVIKWGRRIKSWFGQRG